MEEQKKDCILQTNSDKLKKACCSHCKVTKHNSIQCNVVSGIKIRRKTLFDQKCRETEQNATRKNANNLRITIAHQYVKGL